MESVNLVVCLLCSSAGSYDITRNLESSFNLQVQGPHTSMTSQTYHVVTQEGGQGETHTFVTTVVEKTR